MHLFIFVGVNKKLRTLIWQRIELKREIVKLHTKYMHVQLKAIKYQ